MHFKLIAADKTDVGKQREQNEDSVYKRIESFDDGDRGLFIVADGMGGYQAGEVASKIAIETISKGLVSFFTPVEDQPTIKLSPQMTDLSGGTASSQNGEAGTQAVKTRKLTETPIAKSVEEQFTSAIQQANKEIVRYGERQSGARGLGCTVTAALIQNDRAYIANVGDSRTYLLRDGNLKPLTKDHSLVARLVEEKQIDPEDIYSHPQRNLIYRSLGAGHKTVEVDIFHETLLPNDTLLLCSDGLWEMVHTKVILNELSAHTSPQEISNRLIQLANENGGEDNITAIVIHVTAH
ncbi:MAG: PP2C family protein-serine/threonine phosphatase [Ktedonobacteraceae bacterium]